MAAKAAVEPAVKEWAVAAAAAAVVAAIAIAAASSVSLVQAMRPGLFTFTVVGSSTATHLWLTV